MSGTGHPRQCQVQDGSNGVHTHVCMSLKTTDFFAHSQIHALGYILSNLTVLILKSPPYSKALNYNISRAVVAPFYTQPSVGS